MKTKTKAVADFIHAGELARQLNVTPECLTEWVAAGTVPPPWLRPGRGTRLWRRDHYEILKESGRWPEAAWKGAPH